MTSMVCVEDVGVLFLACRAPKPFTNDTIILRAISIHEIDKGRECGL